MNTPKRYRLLKDVSTFDVEAKAGCIGIEKIEPGGSSDSKVWFDNGRFFYRLSTINTWKDWFEEIIPQPKPQESFTWTEESLVQQFKQLKSYPLPKEEPKKERIEVEMFTLQLSKPIKFDYYKIKQAIEQVLNDEPRVVAISEFNDANEIEMANISPKDIVRINGRKWIAKEQLDRVKEYWYNIGKGVAIQNSPSYESYIKTINQKQTP